MVANTAAQVQNVSLETERRKHDRKKRQNSHEFAAGPWAGSRRDYRPMNESHNENSPNGTLRVGLIADGDEAPRHANAIRGCARLELVAQSGMPQQAALPDVEWHDDSRVLVAQSDIDAAILAISPKPGAYLAEIAAAEGVHVWRAPPLGRNVAEATEVVRRLSDVRVVYRVASWWDHAAESIRWALAQVEDFTPLYSEIVARAPGPPLHSWRSSLSTSAGGVLACDTYAALEALVALRGLPESVMAATGKCRRRKGEAPRETEDVISATYRYDNGGLASVHATWDIPPSQLVTLHHGAHQSIRYAPDAVAVLGPDGETIARRDLPFDSLVREMERFAAEVCGEISAPPTESSTNRHLMVSGLLEATYLSAHTQQPEQPGKLFGAQRWPELGR